MNSEELNGEQHAGGSEGVRLFVFFDMILFTALFVVFTSERLSLPELYKASQRGVDPWFGFINTLILVSSSLFMARAVGAARAGTHQMAVRQLDRTLLLAAAFCVGKVIEYVSKIRHGIGPSENSFFSLYYFITGLHFLHVIGAMVFISSIRNALAVANGSVSTLTVVNMGVFWHFVDVMWVFIFALIYLVGR